MNKMLRVAEVAYIVIFVISLVEVILMWRDGVTGNRFYIFAGFAVLSLAMFFIRRKQRRRMDAWRQEQEEEERNSEA